MFSNLKVSQNSPEFICVKCDYVSYRKKDFNKHLLTVKHIINVQQSDDAPNNQINTNESENLQSIPQVKSYTCVCGKNYKDNSGLWRHKKICEQKSTHDNDTNISKPFVENVFDEKPLDFSDKEIIKLLIHECTEFKNLILDQNKTIMELSKNNMNISNNNNNTNNTNTNNSHNKTFNLQFFLNEECKDALNISEFVSSIKVELEDLEATGRLGYVEGVSRIMNKNLKVLDINKRPIHCSDLKREVLYIKNDDQWTKEEDTKPILKKAIKDVAFENIKLIGEWRKKYPGCMASDSRKNDLYLKIVGNAMSGLTTEEQLSNIDKIVSKVAKEAVINK
jgi:hypothetical protein